MKTEKVFVHECSITGLWLFPWTEEDMKKTGRQLYEEHCEPADVSKECGADLTFDRHGWSAEYPDGEYNVGAVMRLDCLIEELLRYVDTLEQLLIYPVNPSDIPGWEDAMRELWEEKQRA